MFVGFGHTAHIADLHLYFDTSYLYFDIHIGLNIMELAVGTMGGSFVGL
jgi:hypothetical protein